MSEQTITDFDWSPKQNSPEECNKFGSTYSESEGVSPQKVVLECVKTADPNFQTRLPCKLIYFLGKYQSF